MIPPCSEDIPEWLRLALLDIGVREGRDDARILGYRKYTKERPWVGTSGRGSAWCADFVSAKLEESGVRSTRSAGAASYKRWGKECEPKPGAVVVFGPHDPDAAGTGHVGFIRAFPVGGLVEVCSGNCANQVKLKKYRVADIVACRWPEFP